MAVQRQQAAINPAGKGGRKATAKHSEPKVRMWYHRTPSRYVSDQPSMTKQSFKDEVNINTIMSRFISTGQITHLNHNAPNYGVAPSADFREALEIVQNSEESFATLPAEIRQKFGNDPYQFLAFVEDSSNARELADMGLISIRDDQPPPVSEKPENAPTGASEASNEASPNSGGVA